MLLQNAMTKSQLRGVCRKIRAELPEEYFTEAGEMIVSHLLESPVYVNAKSVFCYVSVPSEPPTMGIIQDALSKGKQVWVPRCVSEGIMEAVRIDSPEVLQPGKYGILEPSCGQVAPPEMSFDLAIVPCVSASVSGKRLGHGAGYYDRFLEEHKCVSICLCYGRLIREDIPVESTDVLMDYVITD